jgi:hypothetical protein
METNNGSKGLLIKMLFGTTEKERSGRWMEKEQYPLRSI